MLTVDVDVEECLECLKRHNAGTRKIRKCCDVLVHLGLQSEEMLPF